MFKILVRHQPQTSFFLAIAQGAERVRLANINSIDIFWNKLSSDQHLDG